jgi:hypothetical protein
MSKGASCATRMRVWGARFAHADVSCRLIRRSAKRASRFSPHDSSLGRPAGARPRRSHLASCISTAQAVCRPRGVNPRRSSALPYLCRDPASSAGSVVVGVDRRLAGGACARLLVRVVCARAPSLTSVHDSRVGSGAGDMMFDGVIPLGEALRPLGLSGPSTRTWRQESVGSRPRRIWLTRGLARTGKLMRVPGPPRRARGACGSCA